MYRLSQSSDLITTRYPKHITIAIKERARELKRHPSSLIRSMVIQALEDIVAANEDTIAQESQCQI